MFKFGFDLDLEDEDETLSAVEPTPASREAAKERSAVPSQPFREVDFDDLFATLPPSLSYCPLPLPAHVPSTVAPIVRRDMFDAHFQLIASASEEDEGEAAGADNNEEPETSAAAAGGESADPAPAAWGPETDLVKGVYEGGMKTWECAGDLVGVLQAEVVQDASWKAVEGKRIMEVGCGTAIPSMYLLQELLAKPDADADLAKPPPPRTTFYFLDYNELVLKLVTLPNIVLAFRHLLAPSTPAAAPATAERPPVADPTARRSTSPAPSSADGAAADADEEDEDDEDDDSDSLTLSPARLARFRELLVKRNIDLRFFAGGWDSFALADEAKMDIVLTSETVYQIANLPALASLLRQASYPTAPSAEAGSAATSTKTTALVAAKVLYFGLDGGGVPAFEDAVRATSGGAGWIEEVWRSQSGVKRWVGRIGWSS